MPIYVNFDDGKFKGGVTGGSHKEWVEVNNLQWSSGRHISTLVGNTADRVKSTPSVSEVTFTKEVDSASVGLFTAHLKRTPASMKVQIDFCVDETSDPYMTYTLLDALISRYRVSSSSGRPQESLALNFTEIDFGNLSQDSTAKQDDKKTAGYSLTTGDTK